MSEDIVVQLRGWSEGSSDDSRRMVWLMRQSADTIEALRGEVDLIKTLGVGAALETVAQKERAQKAEAEAARLKGALEEVMGWIEKEEPSFTQYRRWSATELKARKALAGETT